VQKEKLLEFWNDVVQRTGLTVQFQEQFLGLTARADGSFDVKTSRGSYHARSVLLAMGRRGTPRKLGVPGEDEPTVVYRLVDPQQYRGKSVLVVGGGDSALEAAIALAEEPDTKARLSYRGNAFSRVKQKNRERLASLKDAGRLDVLMESKVTEVRRGEVTLDIGGQARKLPADYVIVCAGGVLPTPLLQSVGIQFETKFGRA
jgi:thioredoxin reductase